MNDERALTIEDPTRKAVVDFLSHRFSVTVESDGEKVSILVRASHGEGSSCFTDHDFEVELPEQDEPPVEEGEDDEAEDSAWRREIALEAGMLHGVDAYNDAMGFSAGEPDFDNDGRDDTEE
jgi:hypothetical protein